MSFQQTLVDAGFSPEASLRLLDSEHFTARNGNKSAIEIAEQLFRIAEIYNVNSDTIRKAVLTHPPFAGYDHIRVINGIKEAYGCTDEQAAKAVLTHPRFAGLDHARVLRQQTKIGRLIGVEEDMIHNEILKNPHLAGYSAKRYLAVIDVFRQLDNEFTDVPREHLVDWWLRNCTTSPYVPGMKRERVSHAIEKGNTEEPALMKALRRSAPKLRVKAQ